MADKEKAILDDEQSNAGEGDVTTAGDQEESGDAKAAAQAPPAAKNPEPPKEETKLEMPAVSAVTELLGRWIAFQKVGNEKSAITSLNYAYREMLRREDPALFDDALDFFIKEKAYIGPQNAMVGIATLSKTDRPVVETVTTVLISMVQKTTKDLDLGRVNTIVGNDAFFTWLKKKTTR